MALTMNMDFVSKEIHIIIVKQIVEVKAIIKVNTIFGIKQNKNRETQTLIIDKVNN